MLKIKKIKDKELATVKAQWNCTLAGHSHWYWGEGNCVNDCTRADKPRYYMSKEH